MSMLIVMKRTMCVLKVLGAHIMNDGNKRELVSLLREEALDRLLLPLVGDL